MAPKPPRQTLLFRGVVSSSTAEAHTSVPLSQGVTDRDATVLVPPSIQATYTVVWTAREPPSSSPPRYSPQDRPVTRMTDMPPPALSQRRAVDWLDAGPPPLALRAPSSGWREAGSPAIWPPIPKGRVRITGSTVEGSLWMRAHSQNGAQGAPTPRPIPAGKTPCIATLRRGTLGASSTCLYDRATHSVGDFSVNDVTWGLESGYKDYGPIRMSTKKWARGSWDSVEDDNGNDFLFLTVGREHGLVRVWRPNLVAKRVVGPGDAELTYGERLRLGLDDDDSS